MQRLSVILGLLCGFVLTRGVFAQESLGATATITTVEETPRSLITAPPTRVLVAHSNIPKGQISRLVNGPIGGIGHPSVKGGVIFLTVVVVAVIVIIKLAFPTT